MPRGIRRSEPAHPPAGTVIGSMTILPPVEMAGSEVVVPTHPGAGPGNAKANYRDEASQPKSGKSTVNRKVPFDLKR